MASLYASRKLSFDCLLLVRLILLSILLSRVNAHGWIAQPPSRQEACRAKTVDSQYCDNVQYEPQSVEALKGAPFTRDVGNHICNGGSARFDALNTAGPDIWPNTTVQSGADLTLQWNLTVAHRTTNYQYYLTKPSWSASSTQRLTKDDFYETPITVIDANGTAPPLGFSHTLPGTAFKGQTGYAVLYAVWEIADTTNSFYNCVDLYITTGDGALTAVASTTIAAATSATISARSSATSASTTLANSLITSTTLAAVSTTSAIASMTTSALPSASTITTNNSTSNSNTVQTTNGTFNGTINGTINGTVTNGTLAGIISGTITATIGNSTINETITATFGPARTRRMVESEGKRRRRTLTYSER